MPQVEAQRVDRRIGGFAVASNYIQAAIARQAASAGAGQGKLILVNKPKATVYKFFTVPAAQNNGVEVEKFTTRYGVTFEKHIEANGVTTWWRLLKVV
jgi:hypothetical protein